MDFSSKLERDVPELLWMAYICSAVLKMEVLKVMHRFRSILTLDIQNFQKLA